MQRAIRVVMSISVATGSKEMSYSTLQVEGYLTFNTSLTTSIYECTLKASPVLLKQHSSWAVSPCTCIRKELKCCSESNAVVGCSFAAYDCSCTPGVVYKYTCRSYHRLIRYTGNIHEVVCDKSACGITY